MNLEKLIAVSGVSGLLKVLVTKDNGLILEDLNNGRRRFYSSRSYQFTPLESIAIYVTSEEETVPLDKVFDRMKNQYSDTPPVSVKAENAEIRAYFDKILPEHDKEKVYISDIKKLIKWFNFLLEKNLLEDTTDEPKETEGSEISETATEEA